MLRLSKKITLVNWKWHWFVHVPPPNQQYKQTKSVELVSIAHIWTLYVIIFFIIAFTTMIWFFSKILAQNERSVVSNVFAKNNRKFKNLKNPLVFYIFPSKTSKKLGKHRFFSMEASSRFQDFIQKLCKILGIFKILGWKVFKTNGFPRF